MIPCVSEAELLARCRAIEGFSFAQLASALGLLVPEHPLQRKGWLGQAVERALGATAGNASAPDFSELGVELKTLPLNSLGKPAESTFVTHIPLLNIHEQTWETSQCLAKLKRVLWLPIEGDKRINFAHRRVGRAVLWSPSPEDYAVLSADWQHLSSMVSLGHLEEITASMGDYLQIRPKAAHGQSLCYGFDAEGNKVLTLPRGFYLRASFTNTIF